MGRATVAAVAAVVGIAMIGFGLLAAAGALIGSAFNAIGGSGGGSGTSWAGYGAIGLGAIIVGVLCLGASVWFGGTALPPRDQGRHGLRCRRCGHDLSGRSAGATCPGCGGSDNV